MDDRTTPQIERVCTVRNGEIKNLRFRCRTPSSVSPVISFFLPPLFFSVVVRTAVFSACGSEGRRSLLLLCGGGRAPFSTPLRESEMMELIRDEDEQRGGVHQTNGGRTKRAIYADNVGFSTYMDPFSRASGARRFGVLIYRLDSSAVVVSLVRGLPRSP